MVGTNKNRIYALLAVIVILMIAIIGVNRIYSNKKIRIGVVLPLTGELSNFGRAVRNGVQMSVDDFNINNNINVYVKFEDSQAKPAMAVSALLKLIDYDKVDIVIGSLTSSETLAMVPIANKRKILLISPTASNPKLSNSSPYFYRVWPSDTFDGMIAAKYSYTKFGARKVAIIYINNDYGLGLKNKYNDIFRLMGGKVISIDSYLENASDFRTLLIKIKQNKPDLIYLPGHPRSIGMILKQSRELNMNFKFISNVAAEDKEFINVAGSAANGLIFTSPTYSVNSRENNDFVNKYTKKYTQEPDVHAVKGYEAAAILLEAIKKGNSSADDIRKYINSKKSFNMISGKLTFDKNGDIECPISVKRYDENGLIKVVEVFIEKQK
jgi:branched-chain amino acid transport system substrate-binding protein